MAKWSKEEVSEFVGEVSRYTGYSERQLHQLPRTPGRDKVQRGLDQVREGLTEIKREAEIK